MAAGVVGARRRLGLFDVLAIGVNAIVGSGVFSKPDDMQRSMGGFSALSYLLCALVLIPVALCFAELAGRESENGGPYLYASHAFGRNVGFVVGWSCYLNAFISFAANATQLGSMVGLEGHPAYRPIVVAIVLALGAINYVGIRPSANLIHVMTVGKLLAIFLFIGAALLHFDGSRLGGTLPAGMGGVANGVYLALFPLQGFETVPVPAGETKNPARNVPIATVGSLLFAALLFVVVQAVISASYDDILKESDRPLVEAAYTFGPIVGLLVFIGSVVSVGGFTVGSALGSPRYGQALADGGDLPPVMRSVHPRFGTPHVAIAATTLITAALGAFFTYRELVGFSNVTVVFQYALTCAAVPVLRKKAPLALGASFRVPLGPVLPVLGAVGSVALLSGSSLEEVAWAVGGIALGGVVVVATRRLLRPS
ncbi:MAG: amino acid permease [Polyangiaceae bacterium]|jgi:amino acid transporter|nr:amino acid permease [Polyangiaceae bacterium]MBK8937477.1 amino acid permease [Polyangiaceae bacterium]